MRPKKVGSDGNNSKTTNFERQKGGNKGPPIGPHQDLLLGVLKEVGSDEDKPKTTNFEN